MLTNSYRPSEIRRHLGIGEAEFKMHAYRLQCLHAGFDQAPTVVATKAAPPLSSSRAAIPTPEVRVSWTEPTTPDPPAAAPKPQRPTRPPEPPLRITITPID